MPFVLYEEDQFVRTDITEMLAQSFPDEDVLVASDTAEFSNALITATLPMVAIIGSHLPDAMTPDHISAKRHAVIVVSDDNLLPERDAGLYKAVNRPFSSSMLLDAIRTVIFYQQSFRS